MLATNKRIEIFISKKVNMLIRSCCSQTFCSGFFFTPFSERENWQLIKDEYETKRKTCDSYSKVPVNSGETRID